MIVQTPSEVRRWGGKRPEPTALPAGTPIANRFRVVRLLGSGGMGSVYEALDTNIHRQVAIKLLLTDYAHDPVMAARFEREARAASRIASPFVVTIHDFGRDPEHGLYMVMELLSGESLGSRLDRVGAVGAHAATQLAIQIAEALHAAHAVGIVHRDLKPDNVFLPDEGGIKVLDFGIARVVERSPGLPSTTLTQVGMILGTPLYISPEAVARKKVGPAADLYALGVMLFEMIAGETPFVDDVPTALCTMHLRQPPPRLIDKQPDTPLEVDAVVARLLAKDPRNRPVDANEVIARLSEVTWLDDEPTELSAARPVETPQPQRLVPTVDLTSTIREPPKFVPWWRRRTALLAAGAAGVVTFVAAAIVAAGDRDEPRTIVETRPAPTPPIATEPVVEQVVLLDAPEPPAIGVDEPDEVEVRVTELPAGATLRWDGATVTSPFRAPRDGRAHRLEASAPGYEERAIEVTPERDLLIPLALEPRTRRPGKRPIKMRQWDGRPGR